MSKAYTLTIGERLAALRIYDAFKGSITELAAILDDVKNLAITPKEWEAAKREIIKNGTQESWKWNDEDPTTWKSVQLERSSVEYLAKSIKEKSDKNEITIADVAFISLQKKIS